MLNKSLESLQFLEKKIKANNNQTKQQLQSMFNDGISQINKLLTMAAISKKDSDIVLLNTLLTCTSKKEIEFWINKEPFWWRIILILLDPEYAKHLFWKWFLKIECTALIAQNFPNQKAEVLLRLMLEHFFSHKRDPYPEFVKKNQLSIFSYMKNSNNSWSSLFSQNSDLFMREDSDSIFAEKYVSKCIIPEILFKKNLFPPDAENWDFFDEFYLQTIEATENYNAKGKNKELYNWLLKEIFEKPNSKKNSLAAAEFIINHITNQNSSHFDKIIHLFNQNVENGQYIPNHDFTGKRLQRIQIANDKIEKFFNIIAFNKFFESFEFDINRKNFWEKYISEFQKVRVFLPSNLFYRATRESTYNNRFALLEASSSPPILVMQNHPYCIIEFGITGNALYIHNSNEPIYTKIINSNTLKNVAVFKNTWYSILNRSSKKGRLTHDQNGAWQIIMRDWLLKNMEIEATQ